MHDRVAELAGLRNELANCTNGPRESRRDAAGQVQEQIDRVRGELETEAERLDTRVEQLLQNGQDGQAGLVAEQARAIRAALDEDAPADSPKRPGKRNTAAAKPPQTRGAKQTSAPEEAQSQGGDSKGDGGGTAPPQAQGGDS